MVEGTKQRLCSSGQTSGGHLPPLAPTLGLRLWDTTRRARDIFSFFPSRLHTRENRRRSRPKNKRPTRYYYTNEYYTHILCTHVCVRACAHDNSTTSVPKCNKIKYDLDGGGGDGGGGTVERILMQLETL